MRCWTDGPTQFLIYTAQLIEILTTYMLSLSSIFDLEEMVTAAISTAAAFIQISLDEDRTFWVAGGTVALAAFIGEIKRSVALIHMQLPHIELTRVQHSASGEEMDMQQRTMTPFL